MRNSLLLCVILLAGCGHQKVAVPISETKTVQVEERELTDEQKLTLLRTETHKRGLRWRIFCTSDPEPRYNFLAEAEIKTHSEPFILYVEDGGQAQWAGFGDTQASAAYNLLQSIEANAEPPHQAQHRPDFRTKEKMCPPELHGQ